MAGDVISISFSPFGGDLPDLWRRVTALLAADFALDLEDSEIGELVHTDDAGWSLGAGLEGLDLSLEDFLRLSQGIVLRADLWSLGLEFHAELSFFRDPPTLAGKPCLCVSFGTILHRQLFPEIGQHNAEDHPKRALLRLCFALVETTETAAFIIESNNERLLRPVDPVEFAQFLLTRPERVARAIDMQSRLALLAERLGYYQGIASEYVSRAELADAWSASGVVVREAIHGYVTIDVL